MRADVQCALLLSLKRFDDEIPAAAGGLLCAWDDGAWKCLCAARVLRKSTRCTLERGTDCFVRAARSIICADALLLWTNR